MKNGTEVTLNLSLNVIGDSSDESNFQHKYLLSERLVSRQREAFANNLSTNRKLSKVQLFKIVQSGGFLGRVFRSLLRTSLSLMKNILRPLA